MKTGLPACRPFRSTSSALSAFSSISISRGRTAPLRNRSVYKVRVELGTRTGARTPRGGRHRGAGAGQRELRGAGLFAGIGHSLRDGLRPQPLRRAQLSPAFAAHPRLQRAGEAQPHRGAGEGQEGGGGGRLDRARHHLQSAGEQSQGSRRQRSACAGELPAAHAPVRLRHRFSGSQQADGRQLFAARRSGNTSMPIPCIT